MSRSIAIRWMTFAGVIGLAFGVFYSIFGLGGLPAYHKLVPATSLEPWSNGLYGAVFIGFCILLLFIGRYAFQINDKKLMRILLYGVGSWLAVEALYSLIYGIYFNVGIDIALMVLLGFPLLKGIKGQVN